MLFANFLFKYLNNSSATQQLVQRAFRRISGPWAMLIFMAQTSLPVQLNFLADLKFKKFLELTRK